MNMAGYEEKLAALIKRYKERTPLSAQSIEAAKQYMPGGNTRTVLYYAPYPVVLTHGDGAYVYDLDGHRYLDCVGEFSAGLYGHKPALIQSGLQEVLQQGLTLGGPNTWEQQLAALLCDRFPSLERVRFCNSGTEANLYALVTAIALTGRSKVLVFDGAFHGGVLTFPDGPSSVNAPFEWVILPYNDVAQTRTYLQQFGNELAAILVEPILGAAGNIPGDQSFLQMLREESKGCGALLIFDEVKTSRCGQSGMQGLLNIVPDMSTYGKYIGGGMTFGAFGGRATIMDSYDPQSAHRLNHPGTFNNNVLSMAAGVIGLSQIYTKKRADHFHEQTEQFKTQLENAMQAEGWPITLTGHGSMFSINLGPAPRNAKEVTEETRKLRQLVHLRCRELGVRLASRGDIYLNIEMNARDLELLQESLLTAVREVLTE